MTSSPSSMRHLHADHHGFLADIQMAEAADQTHAIKLAGLLLEPADQQHRAVGPQEFVAIRTGVGLLAAFFPCAACAIRLLSPLRF